MTDLRIELQRHKENYELMRRLANSGHIQEIGKDGKRKRIPLSTAIKNESDAAIKQIDEALATATATPAKG